MNKKNLSIVCVLFAACFLAFITGKNGDELQPIAYNHNIHVEENGIECTDCHKYAEENARASIPNIAVCRDCHEEAITESEQEQILLGYINENELIPWRQIYSVPDYAYFSHRRHVKLGTLKCEQCHGEVGTFTEPIVEPANRIVMAWCTDCHEERSVTNDCYACHR